jgi:hypothetical protein
VANLTVVLEDGKDVAIKRGRREFVGIGVEFWKAKHRRRRG